MITTNDVYATAYNIKTALKKIDVHEDMVDQQIITDQILNKPIHLPTKNVVFLRTLYLFLEDPQHFMKKYFKGWKDTYTFVVEEAPKYHRSDQCPWLLKDFYNVEIPSKIKTAALVQELRNWTKQNVDILNRQNIDEFKKGLINFFNKTYNLGLSFDDLKSIDRQNSGAEIVINDLGSIEARIGRMVDNMKKDFSSGTLRSYDQAFRESNYQYKGEYARSGTYVERKVQQDLLLLKHEHIIPLFALCCDYVFVRFRKDSKYSAAVLDLLNFEKCKSCYR